MVLKSDLQGKLLCGCGETSLLTLGMGVEVEIGSNLNIPPLFKLSKSSISLFCCSEASTQLRKEREGLGAAGG